MSVDEVLGLCEACRGGDHQHHELALGGICIGCVCSVRPMKPGLSLAADVTKEAIRLRALVRDLEEERDEWKSKAMKADEACSWADKRWTEAEAERDVSRAEWDLNEDEWHKLTSAWKRRAEEAEAAASLLFAALQVAKVAMDDMGDDLNGLDATESGHFEQTCFAFEVVSAALEEVAS